MKFHTMDEIYVDGLTPNKSGFDCTVCHRKFKTATGATRHINARSCWNMSHIFKDTPIELTIKGLANILLSRLHNVRAYSSIKSLRKTNIYQLLAKLIVYNIANDINDIENYLMWGMHKITSTTPSIILNFLIKDRLDFKDFYNFRRSVLTNSEQSRFYDTNVVKLLDDPNFMIRQVQKGLLTFEYISSKINIQNWMNDLSDVQAHKVRQILIGDI